LILAGFPGMRHDKYMNHIVPKTLNKITLPLAADLLPTYAPFITRK
jgi:hypothetical protein